MKKKPSNGNADGVNTSPAIRVAAGDSLDPDLPGDQDDGDLDRGADEDAMETEDDDIDTDAVSVPSPTTLS